jgi:hypothetical protein
MSRHPARIRLALWLLPLLGLAGCAGFGGLRDVTVSQEQLQARIDRQFPRQQRLLEIIDVIVARPALRLLPERNRVATDLDLSATERLSGRTARGSLALEYALRFEPSDASVRLAQVQVLDAKLELGGAPLSPSAARVGALLAERLLDDFVLYRADAERLKLIQLLGVTAAEIVVTSRGVEIRFTQPR